jgi:hypothetical protein
MAQEGCSKSAEKFGLKEGHGGPCLKGQILSSLSLPMQVCSVMAWPISSWPHIRFLFLGSASCCTYYQGY